MAYSVPTLERLVDVFARLPGIGRKTAQRLAMYMLTSDNRVTREFVEALTEAKNSIKYCSVCQNLTDSEVCSICRSATRDNSVICVVEQPQDVMAFERTREYNGLYHVLHGALSPMDGIGPEALKIKELMARLSNDSVKEIILATDPTVEGETTASYISRLVKPLGIKVTRLAYGIPVGSDLEYADEVTLARALEGRNEL